MPTLSHSQCELWAKCPKAWALQKIERAPQAPSPALLLGTAVHAAIEYDGRKFIEYGYRTDEDGLVSVFADALADAISKDDPGQLISPDESADMLAKGAAILTAYVAHLQPRYRPTAVEESFTVDIPGAPGWTFTGRIDARVTLADGTHAVIDFKTGRAWKQDDEHDKPQATAYTWALETSAGGQAEAVMFVIFPTETDGQGGYICLPQFRRTTRTLAQTEAYAASLVDTAAAIEASRATGQFPAKTSALCAYCGCLGSCQTGRDYLARTGRAPAIPMVTREGGEHDAL